MGTKRHVSFGPFMLDLASGDLEGPAGPVKLDAQPAKLLTLLVARAGTTVSRDEIERALWNGEVTVDFDGSIRSCIRKIRIALGDEASSPRYIETATGRGYRFIGDVRGVSPARTATSGDRPPMVGRAGAMAELERALEDARTGRGHVIFVSGEAGIGKTTLVEAFVSGAEAAGATVLRGLCSERLEGADAYGPLVEAMENLLGSEGTRRHLERLAPSWFAELEAGPRPPESRERSQRRLYREISELVQSISSSEPAVLFLDDVHWADRATLDLIVYLAERMGALRLLVLLTYRTKESRPLAFRERLLDMISRKRCREIELTYLTRDDVAAYLAERLGPHAFPEGLVDVVHEQTAGKPLFMVELLRDALERGLLVLDDGRYRFEGSTRDLRRRLPETLQSLIDRKLDQLDAPERELLGFAAIAGFEFHAAVLARALDRELPAVEEMLQSLYEHRGVIRVVEEVAMPGGTPTLLCRFVHVQYQDTLLRSLLPARRVRASRAVAEALQTAYGERRVEVAAELATLYREAREPAQAIEHFLLAARKASAVFAYEDCAELVHRGLELLDGLSGDARDTREIELLQLLVAARIATQGFSAGELADTLSRSLTLYRGRGDRGRVYATLFGLFAFRGFRGELEKAGRLCQELWEDAERAAPEQRLIALWARGLSFFLAGDIEACRDYYERALALYDPAAHRAVSDAYPLDTGVGVFSQASWAFWYGGYPARALGAMERALDYAKGLTPLNGVIARGFAAHLAYLDDRVDACETLAREAMNIAEEYALRPFAGWAGLHLGWARVRRGGHEAGFAALAGGMDELTEAGSKLMTTAHLALYADACRIAGWVEPGLELVERALAFAEGGERFHTPELYRLRGELLKLGGENARAEASFRNALDLAASPSMRARLLELRAAMSLARLLADEGRKGEARNVLSKDHFFLDDAETADRRRARALLRALST